MSDRFLSWFWWRLYVRLVGGKVKCDGRGGVLVKARCCEVMVARSIPVFGFVGF